MERDEQKNIRLKEFSLEVIIDFFQIEDGFMGSIEKKKSFASGMVFIILNLGNMY